MIKNICARRKNMLADYLIVHKSILPDYYEKVLETKRLLENGNAKDVSQAVKLAGISRSTYYKYKDYILEPSEMSDGRMAVISVILNHEPGILSSLLSKISDVGGSVVTITQSMPIHEKAQVTLTLDVSAIPGTLEDLMFDISKTQGVEKPRLLAVE